MNPTSTPLAPVADAIGQALQNHFIGPSKTADLASNFVAFRGEFTSRERPQNATLHLFADARYLLWVNGTYAGRGPARFETRGPQYDSLPVAPLLQKGVNSIVLLLLSGVSNGRIQRHAPGLCARLDMDGATAMTTDESWKWSDQTQYRAPIVHWEGVYDRIDTRAQNGDWTQPTYDDGAWQNAQSVSGESWGPLTARRIPLLRETTVEMTIEGAPTFPITLEAGQKLNFATPHLVQAYTMLDFETDEDSAFSFLHTDAQRADAHDEIIAGGGRHHYISSDTSGFFGGSLQVTAGRVTIHDWKTVELLYPFDVVGQFDCEDALLNDLWKMCARSCQVFSEDAYVDCADRERVEWMDCDPPAFDITRTALASVDEKGAPLYADARLLGALLRRVALTQQRDGWVKAHTCSDRFDIHAYMEDRSCDWVQGARRYYESCGDGTLIREIWPVIISQLEYLLDHRTPRGLVRGREWEVWGNPVGYIVCEGAGLNAFVYKALIDAAFLGRVIGDSARAAQFEVDAKNLQIAFNTVLWDEENGTYFSGYGEDEAELAVQLAARSIGLELKNHRIAPTMLPALLALDQQIVPAERRARVTNYFLQNFSPDQYVHEMIFYYAFKQMLVADTAELDQKVLDIMREKWAAMARFPWQVSWEIFDGGWSRAHIYGMFPGYFLSSYVLGVRVAGRVEERHLLIEPRLGDLKRVSGSVVSELGLTRVKWELAANQLNFEVDIPANTRATLHLPRVGGENLMIDGVAAAVVQQGRYLAVEVGAGLHRGTMK